MERVKSVSKSEGDPNRGIGRERGAARRPDGSGFPVGGRPYLSEVRLADIVAVRNPRHTSHPHRSRASQGARATSATSATKATSSASSTLATRNSTPQDMERGALGAHALATSYDGARPRDLGPGSRAADSQLEGLARSLGAEDDPRLTEPPVVEELPDGRYRLCAGERRVEAARLANWTAILCMVYPPLDPVRAHTLSLLENLHRSPMHPLEEISALCISRLLANADARNLGSDARSLLEHAWARQESSYSVIRGLEYLLIEDGWTADRPDVSWKAHLDDLGISMATWERKRKLRLLNIQPAQQERLLSVDITEAALHALGTLRPADQEKVVDALIRNPDLAGKVRRIARARRDGFYDNIEDALAEVQGWRVGASTASGDPEGEDASSRASASESASAPPRATPLSSTSSGSGEDAYANFPVPGVGTEPTDSTAPRVAAVPSQAHAQEPVPAEIQDAVLQLLECAERLSSAMLTLRSYRGGAALIDPWGTWSGDALDFIKRELEAGR